MPMIRSCAGAALRRLVHPPSRSVPARAAAALVNGHTSYRVDGAGAFCAAPPRQLSTSSPNEPDGDGRSEQLRKLGFRDAKPRPDDNISLPLPFNKSSNAVFIDAQNASVDDIPLIAKHVQTAVLPPLSQPSVKKIYGDATLLDQTVWSQYMEEHDLDSPYDVDNVNIDSMMAMDATECLLKQPHIHTYILITGDGDFAPLVHKLREKGKIVIGYGPEERLAAQLAEACHHYFDTNELVMADPDAWARKIARDEGKRKKKGRQEGKGGDSQSPKEEEQEEVAEKGQKAAEQADGEQVTLVKAASDAIGSLFADPAKPQEELSKEDSSTSEERQKKKGPWWVGRPKKKIRPKPDGTFASSILYHKNLLRVPKGLLKQCYRDKHDRTFQNSCFCLEPREFDGEMWYTATFTDPITKERFWSGIGAQVADDDSLYWGPHINPPLHLADVTIAEGKVYYSMKNHAKHAAAARAIDCYVFRESGYEEQSAEGEVEKETVPRMCLEDPYMTFREGYEQQVDYDALLSQRESPQSDGNYSVAEAA